MLSADSVAQFPVDNVKAEISVITAENQTADTEGSEFKQPLQDATLSRKQRRVCLKRDRRKRKRQALAKLRGYDIVDQCENAEDRDDDADEKAEEELRDRLHQEWMEREKIAQEEFRLKREREEAAQKRKEEEEKRIKEEWEEQQRREREEQEQRQQERRNREIYTNERMTGLQAYSSSEENEAVQKMLDQAESQLENGSSWKNPDAPADYGTEKDKANCPFFLKTGACRFGDRCSRKHDHPVSSSTLMVRGMFVTFGMEQSRRDDYDTDASLEYSEEELHQQFLDFYEDVLPEFRNVGKVMQFKVSCNFEPHLRGNVYVQYENEDQCKEAFKKFNGRWYAGRQLQCEFSPVTRWKTAICGLFDRQKCPKGKHCNFLHVFRNPSNEFWEADRDLHLSPDRSGGFTGRHSERRDRMSQRNHSPGWSRYRWSSRRSHSRERQNRRRRRSRSRERRSRSRERRSRSRSRERRSQFSLRRGNGRVHDLSRRSGSHEKRRSHSRGRDSDRQSRGRHSLTDSKWSSRRSESASPKDQSSKDASVKRRSKSPKRADASDDANTSLHHHKHSKKSKKKKKNKKKHKRKRSKTHSISSSPGSNDDDEDGDDETLKNRDKQNTDLPGEDVGTAENITSLQQGHAETRSNTFCQHEDENHQTLVVTESSTAALSNENV